MLNSSQELPQDKRKKVKAKNPGFAEGLCTVFFATLCTGFFQINLRARKGSG